MKERTFSGTPLRTLCPICGSSELKNLGEIVHSKSTCVAGIELDLRGQKFNLIACQRCRFQMKDPPIPEDKLIRCYENSASDHWEEDPDPYVRQFDLFRELLEEHATGHTILDIGCFNGAMLQHFGDEWERLGVEPSDAAVAVAEERNVRILGSTLDDLERESLCCDVVSAIDVVEHLVDPMPFFRKAFACVKPGGLFLVVTGDTGTLPWKLQGNLYYYCRFAEHVAFYCRQTMEYIGSQLGMACEAYRVVSHKRLPRSRWLRDAWRNAFYLLVCRAKGFGVPRVHRTFRQLRGPTFFPGKDHMICLFRRIS